MRIETIDITDFRNIDTLSAEFSEGVNIFYGLNGSGKTNLLEAIFVLCLGRSQRGAGDVILVRGGQLVYRLAGSLATGEHRRTQSVAYQRGGRKKVTLDGVGVRLSELYDGFSIVSIGPEDSAILSGAPSIRRGFLDIYLSQQSARYLSNLTDYSRTLAQKNAALKAEADATPFDQLLVKYGSEVVLARHDFLRSATPLARQYYDDISGGGSLEMSYDPSLGLLPEQAQAGDIEGIFEQRLASVADRETYAGQALVGPHRDDIAFVIENNPARTHASQGEWRTAAIALKLAAYRLMRDKLECSPVLLLDEIFAELDQRRTAYLIDLFADFGQLFLTTAGEPPEPLRQNGGRFRIDQGQLERVS